MRRAFPFTIIALTLAFVILGISNVYAKSSPARTSSTGIREDSRYILRHSASILQRAKTYTHYQKNRRTSMKDYYSPADPGPQLLGLEKAIELQERAKDYFVQGMYQPAIDYSLDARIIALRLMEDAAEERNRTNTRSGDGKSGRVEIDPREVRYWENHRSSLLLDQEINGLELKENETVPRFMEYDF